MIACDGYVQTYNIFHLRMHMQSNNLTVIIASKSSAIIQKLLPIPSQENLPNCALIHIPFGLNMLLDFLCEFSICRGRRIRRTTHESSCYTLYVTLCVEELLSFVDFLTGRSAPLGMLYPITSFAYIRCNDSYILQVSGGMSLLLPFLSVRIKR